MSCFADQGGLHWWAKAWFNGRELGEPAVEVGFQVAQMWWHDELDKDEFLEEYYPRQMEAVHKAIAETRAELIEKQEQMQQSI